MGNVIKGAGSRPGNMRSPSSGTGTAQASTPRQWSLDTPVRDSYLVFGSPQILEPEIVEVLNSLRSAWIGTGPKVARFERNFAEYIGGPYVAAVNSCTAALHLALTAIELQPGDEVILPSMTFAATANAVVHAAAMIGSDHQISRRRSHNTVPSLSNFPFRTAKASHCHDLAFMQNEVDPRLLQVWVILVLPPQVSRVYCCIRTPKVGLQLEDLTSEFRSVCDHFILVQHDAHSSLRMTIG